jgi:TonB family protein
MENRSHKKTKKFLKLPTYPGGRDAYRKFVSEQLVYPAQALENGIQGTVYLSYVVDDFGDVIEAKILKGIGYGCDEEALRIVRLLNYNKVNNRGFRLRSEIKTGIRFILPVNATGVQYTYTVTPTSSENAPEKDSPYSYTITIKEKKLH